MKVRRHKDDKYSLVKVDGNVATMFLEKSDMIKIRASLQLASAGCKTAKGKKEYMDLCDAFGSIQEY